MAVKKRLRLDTRGAAAVEFAIGLPAFLLLCYGLMQFALVLWAQSSLAHAAGQAARYATIFPTPTDAQIETFTRSAQLGINADKIDSVNVSRGTDGGRQFAEIEINYSTTVELIFAESPDITLQHKRRVYLPPS